MKTSQPNYGHFFDFTHWLKLPRNILLHHWVNIGLGPTFSMKTLYEVWKTDLRLQSYLKLCDLFPTDVMDIDPILHITDERVTFILETHSSQAVKDLGKYLKHMKLFYNTWSKRGNSSQNNLDTKIKELEEQFIFWSQVSLYGSDILYQLETNITSLKLISTICKQLNVDLPSIAHFSTLGIWISKLMLTLTNFSCREQLFHY